MGSIPGSERSLGGGNGNPLQYSFLGIPMDRGAWCGPKRVRHGLVTKQQHPTLLTKHPELPPGLGSGEHPSFLRGACKRHCGKKLGPLPHCIDSNLSFAFYLAVWPQAGCLTYLCIIHKMGMTIAVFTSGTVGRIKLTVQGILELGLTPREHSVNISCSNH